MHAIMLPEFQMGIGNKYKKKHSGNMGLMGFQLSFFSNLTWEQKKLPIDLMRSSN